MPQIFPLDAPQRALLLRQAFIISVLGDVLILDAFTFQFFEGLGIPLAVLTFLVAGLILWQRTHTRLVVSAEGLTYRQLSLELFTPWSNVERVELVTGTLGLLSLQVEALVLREPAQPRTPAWTRWLTGWGVLTQLGQQGRLIPLHQFPRWRASAIAQAFNNTFPICTYTHNFQPIPLPTS